MLIEFRVENHRSLRDEQALTLEAGRFGESFDTTPRHLSGHDDPLLPAIVIYGANASGKSNVLAALAFMREAVSASQRVWEPDAGIPRTAFAWGDKPNATSMFEVSFLLGGTKFVYGFVIDDNIVDEEWLFAWPNNRKQVWFEREAMQFKFGENLQGPNEAVKEVTRSNSLYLSAAAQHGHRQLTALYSWFRRIFLVNVTGRRFPMAYPGTFDVASLIDDDQLPLFPHDESEDTAAARIRQLLHAADVGIVDIKTIESAREGERHRYQRRRIMLQHQAGDEHSWLNLADESEGTKTLFRMAPSLFRVLDTGGVLLVDELESSLHPLLGLAIVKMFNCPKANPRNAQILFTTHDTNLLGTTLDKPSLRRDQIWFTEKDKQGATKLYPLTDYKPRKSENLERGYLQGRYGAIPFLGNIAWGTE